MATNLLSKFNLDNQEIEIKDSTARTTASNALSTANTANSTANSAKSTAETAKSTADSAKATGDTNTATINKILAESRVTLSYSATNETMTITTTTHATN